MKKDKIRFVGVGNYGNIIISSNIEELSKYNHLIIDTSYHDLAKSFVSSKIQIGEEFTKGLGAQGNPVIGEHAAIGIKKELELFFNGAELVFIFGGMGGGTATGAISVIAEIAKNMGILTVSMVTIPFSFEGKERETIALAGIDKLMGKSDGIFVIKNDHLILETEKTIDMKNIFSELGKSFYRKMEIILNLLKLQGTMPFDFNKLESILRNGDLCLLTSGKALGIDRAKHALENALNNPYYSGSISNAEKILLNISSNGDIEVYEFETIKNLVKSYIKNKIEDFLLGITINNSLEGEIEVTILGTNISNQKKFGETTLLRESYEVKNDFDQIKEKNENKNKKPEKGAIEEISIPKWIKG
ncbi:hypothetical protein [Fusobacterium sp. PH5-44]|uniref:hypothetical protein n=1 Tax=unclassified Fusobacterium TaxID=2648384 RepID=UPI003D1CA01A